MGKIKLKPCPFCGGNGIIREFQSFRISTYYPECDNENCVASDTGIHFDTEQEAAEAWNKRAYEGS